METPLMPLPPPEERRKLRDQMGVTRKEAADEIGVDTRTYLRWEWGKNQPSYRNHRKYWEQLTRWQNLVNDFL
jgi:predicted transcriptional regulator